MKRRLYRSPLGVLEIGFLGGAVVQIRFLQKEEVEGFPPLSGPLREALDRYFRGEPENFEGVPVDLRLVPGTFARRVLEVLRAKVPYGHAITYGELARRVRRPGAARAVGRALAANPVPILIPCHRVVARSGLGGYSGGLERKCYLLALEGLPFSRCRDYY